MRFKLLGIILFSIFMILFKGMSFGTLFIISTVWIIYGSFVIKGMSKNKRWIRLLAHTYQSLVVVFIASFLIIEGILVMNMSQFKEAQDIEQLEYMIVLGAGLNGEEVGKVLKSRLDEALKYYELNKDVTIIVSGGQGADEVISEAQAMSNYLVENGVSQSQIIKEDRSTTTLENIKFSKEILKSRGDEEKKVLIITNDFHLYRAMLIATILGAENEGLASETPIKVRINYMLREYPTLIIDVVRTIMARKV